MNEITKKQNVLLATSFRDLVGKKLCLGSTRFMVRHGVLSEGHETLTNAQKYFKAIQNAYPIGNSIVMEEANKLDAEADLMDAECFMANAELESDRIRGRAKLIRAKQRLHSCEVNIEDMSRQLDELLCVYRELQPEIDAKYPDGIEQAEFDNWKAIAEYRALKNQMGAHESMQNIPMSAIDKAKIGMENGSPQMMAWFLSINKEEITKKYNGNADKFLEDSMKGIRDGKNILP